MANRRVIVKRRKTVRNIRKITRTMQLIATARFQTAEKRATAARPYVEKLSELLEDLAAAVEEVKHPLMHACEDANLAAAVVLTSNRGLCGGYNSHVLRTAVAHLDELKSRGVETSVRMVGKKGVSYFRFLQRPVAERITHIGDQPRFDDIRPIADALMERFSRGELSSVDVVYMRFFSAGRQSPVVMRLLPLAQSPLEVDQPNARAGAKEYEFSPDPRQLLDELLPAAVRAKLFQCFIDAAVSEQIARMTAMKAATDAAGEMIRTLTRQYNRARQTQITLELLDIVGGANALE